MDILDTDVLIDIQRRHPPAVAWFSTLTTLPAVPGIFIMELIQDARNLGEVQQAQRLVAPLPIVWPTEADCKRALSDFASFHLSHGLGLLDAIIAACAVGRSATLQTFNRKHYAAVPRLMISEPYIR
ncbi:MAG TPA: PIN domain-containing protein [Pirellulales bacterium]